MTPTHTQKAIQKAILAGYKGYPGVEFVAKDGETFKFGGEVNEYRIFLDPLFWQTLGTALGWKKKWWWVSEWHRFIDNLNNGKDPQDFFESLLTA